MFEGPSPSRREEAELFEQIGRLKMELEWLNRKLEWLNREAAQFA